MFQWWVEESLPSHALLSTLNDPSLWIINVKPGMEKDVFQRILNSSFTLSCRFTIISIFMLPGVVGHLYVEAATICYGGSTPVGDYRDGGSLSSQARSVNEDPTVSRELRAKSQPKS
ncbi:hypothetical protein AcW1_000947 [Taiwanofungus camphoratus]|nr:hypothetical protein AcW1_000947 [Antrodia cinnamomea]